MPKVSKYSTDLSENYQSDLAKAIGLRLRSQRAVLHLSQEEVRTRLELRGVTVSRSQFSRFEHGEALPNAAEIVILCEVMQLSVTWLLLGNESE